MSNATTIAIHDLTGNAGLARPSAAVLDTGTAAVTLPLAISGRSADRTFAEVTNTSGAALRIDVLAGDDASIGHQATDSTLAAALAAGATALVGPFDPDRFLHKATSAVRLRFTPASGTIGATIRAYRLPRPF